MQDKPVFQGLYPRGTRPCFLLPYGSDSDTIQQYLGSVEISWGYILGIQMVCRTLRYEKRLLTGTGTGGAANRRCYVTPPTEEYEKNMQLNFEL